MYATRQIRTTTRKSLRASDIFGLIAGATLLAGVLSTLVFLVPKLRPAHIELTAGEIAENERKAAEKVALAHREGSIIFVEPEVCHEHTFDNWTGSIAYKEKVDCDARIEKLRTQDAERTAERMRSVAEGFRR